jgi:hypothetical protein
LQGVALSSEGKAGNSHFDNGYRLFEMPIRRLIIAIDGGVARDVWLAKLQ